MTKMTVLAAALLVATAPMALAQTPPPPPLPGAAAPGSPERGPGAQARPGERGERGRGGREDRADRRDERREGRMHHRGPGPRGMGPESGQASLHVDMGPGWRIVVRCGEEAIGACVGAAQPLLDAMAEAHPGAAGRPGGPAGGGPDRAPPPAGGAAVNVPPPPGSLPGELPPPPETLVPTPGDVPPGLETDGLPADAPVN